LNLNGRTDFAVYSFTGREDIEKATGGRAADKEQ